MQCIKCGRDVESGEVFCETCHADMEKYPVKPGTVVILPHSPQYYPQSKRGPVRIVPPEEQIRKLKIRNRILLWVLMVCVALSAATVWMAASLYIEYEGKLQPGQNYSAVGAKEETEPAETEQPTDAAWDDMFHVKQGE